MYIKQRLYGSSFSRLNDVCMHSYINIHVYVCMFVFVCVGARWGGGGGSKFLICDVMQSLQNSKYIKQ